MDNAWGEEEEEARIIVLFVIPAALFRLYLDSTHRFLLICLCCTLAHSKAPSSVTTGSTRTARATCWETWRAVCLCCCWRRRSWWMARWHSKTCTWNCSGRSVFCFFSYCVFIYTWFLSTFPQHPFHIFFIPFLLWPTFTDACWFFFFFLLFPFALSTCLCYDWLFSSLWPRTELIDRSALAKKRTTNCDALL